MAFLWRYVDEAGVVADGPAVTFPSQESAEDWLDEQESALLDDGVSAVILFDEQQALSGPLPLGADRA
ncbi:hypothetical protein JL107_11580 [Nakamurella flavida]|uniref:Uncharacterized protein n=1 Tax=Nakamurella flavida TaxID=363630 RepID=A0A939C5N6_9ACTN|nr:hypothetical protein [Nakamurella flavida]MBM9477089.1 hypothetical protein [Nakamurella flavida]MDP9780035.1 hypothetical protein [Nakamurella flavida]